MQTLHFPESKSCLVLGLDYNLFLSELNPDLLNSSGKIALQTSIQTYVFLIEIKYFFIFSFVSFVHFPRNYFNNSIIFMLCCSVNELKTLFPMNNVFYSKGFTIILIEQDSSHVFEGNSEKTNFFNTYLLYL